MENHSTLGPKAAEIFFKVDATAAQISAVRQALKGDTRVASSQFLDHTAVYREFAEDFKDQPDLVNATTPDALPEEIKLTVVYPENAEAVRADYKDRVGVDTVVTSAATPHSCG